MPSILAAGASDGSVSVYRLQGAQLVCRSSLQRWQHGDPVWGLAWQPGETPRSMEFVSAGSDGRVAGWRVERGGLQHALLMDLLPGGLHLPCSAGLCVSFHCTSSPNSTVFAERWPAGCVALQLQLPRVQRGLAVLQNFSKLLITKTQVLEHVYVVGTLEGVVFRCSTAHTSSPLQAYHGHTGAVTAVQWNPVHSGAFVTASCDWTVAVWDVDISQVRSRVH